MRLTVPLHVHVSTMFLVLILVVGSLLAVVGHTMSERLINSVAEDLTQRIGRETSGELQRLLKPANTAIHLMQFDQLASAAQLGQRMARLPLIKSALDSTPGLSAIYIGYPNGDFFYVRRLQREAERERIKAPSAARYVVQSIERRLSPARGRFIYLDARLNVLRSTAQSSYPAAYDPRSRDWYKQALSAAGSIMTNPYLFFSDRQIGTTLATQASDHKGVVIGVDILLETLGSSLSRQKLTPHSQLALINQAGDIFAHEDAFPLVRGGSADHPELARLDNFGIPILTELARQVNLAELPDRGSLRQVLSSKDDDWQVSVSTLDVSARSPLLLVIAVPNQELLAYAYAQARMAGVAMVVIILLSIPLAWVLARNIARPLTALVKEAESIRHFEFGHAIDLQSHVLEVNTLALTVGQMKRTIRQFLDISSAISAEKNFDRLLPRLLGETVSAVEASAGILYLSEAGGLKPVCARDVDGTMLSEQDLAKLHRLAVDSVEVDSASGTPVGQGETLLGQALHQGRVMAGPLPSQDILALGLSELSDLNWPTHATAVPLLNRQRELVGAMLLLSDAASEKDRLSFVSALSGTAAVTLEAQALINEQKALFESFVQLIANAIDTKSAYTGGHCARVPELTTMLAQAVCDVRQGPYQAFHLNEEGWETLRVAAWLHDCGKVTTPEYVVDKATKLDTLYNRIHEVRMRFEVLKRDAEIECLQAILQGDDEAACRQRMAAQWAQLDADFAFVAHCNEGHETLTPEQGERLQRIAQRSWLRTLDDRLGTSWEEQQRHPQAAEQALPVTESVLADKAHHLIERTAHDLLPADNRWGFRMAVPPLLYNLGELHNLSVAHGTLTEEERYKINQHIVQTEIMLRQLPFPRHLQHVPEIASGHHEKMDGTGYPKGLHKEALRPETRMLAIADIFEALTAVDRPYKKGKSLSEAVAIMATMSAQGHIDPDLFEIFLISGVYRQYAERFLKAEQIDEVEVSAYLDKGTATVSPGLHQPAARPTEAHEVQVAQAMVP